MPWDQGPGLRCPGALVPGFPSKINDHPSVLPFEMYSLEPGESPTHSLNWKSLGFLTHIKRRTNGDRFPLSLWEVWVCSTLGVPIPVLIGPFTV